MKRKLITMLCIIICFVNITQFHVYAVEEKTVNSVEVMVGSGETYTNINSLFNDTSITGDVVAILTGDVRETIKSSLEIPDTYTSFTIKSNTEVVRNWDIYDPKILFANGKELTIENTITVKGVGTASITLYGGSKTKDVTSSIININGKVDGEIYGGSLDYSITSDVTLTITGSVIGNVYGGGNSQTAPANIGGNVFITISGDVTKSGSSAIGYVYGGGFVNLNDYVEKNANVEGNINIIVEETGSVEKIIGGGFIQVKSDVVSGKATAKVKGNINLNLQGTVKEGSNSPDSIIGGGYIYTLYFSAPTASFTADASVLGKVDINFGSDFKGSDQLTEVTGGGYVNLGGYKITTNQEAIADVKSVKILATKDRLAASSQKNSQAFGYVHGGGYAKGNGAQANVLENTNIEIARACWNSDLGLIGGGVSASGGTANVNGTTYLTVMAIENQKSGYENMNGIFGGGYTFDNDTESTKQSTANVKNTSIHIMPSTTLTSGSTHAINIVGGGYAKGSTKCSASAAVLGNIDILIEKNVTIAYRVFGGGYIKTASGNPGKSATPVKGNISIVTKENCRFESELYGGSHGESWDSQYINDVSIGGDINIELGNSNILQKDFYGGTMAYYCSYGDVSGDIRINVGNDCEFKGEFVAGGTATYGNTKTNVLGQADITLNERNKFAKKITIGGVKDDAKVKQASLTVLGSTTNPYYIERGYVANNADVNVGKDQEVKCNIGYLNGIDNFIIHKNATAYQTDKSYGVLFNVKNVDIKEGGKLQLLNSQINKETIKGDFVSYGILEMVSNIQLNIEGKTSGDTEFIINDTPIKDHIYIKTKTDNNAQFKYLKDGLKIDKIIEENEVLWQLVKTNKPNIISTELSKGIIGSQYSFQLETDSQNPVSWSLVGELPNGLSLEEDTGIISGIPTEIGMFSFDIVADNGSLDKDQKTLSIEIKDISSVITIDLYKNDELWNHHNKIIKLINDDSVISDLTNVPNGTYKIYVEEEYVNQEIIVDGHNQTVRIDYYTIDVLINTIGNITNTKLIIKADNKEIGNHSILLKGTPLSMTLIPEGADQYEYLWNTNQTQSSIDILHINQQLNLNCTITGRTTPPPETNDLTGINTGDIYIHGDEGKFEAIGGGLDNKNPIQGDMRWLPARWKVNPSGIFDPNGPFDATFDTAIMKIGTHILHVYFTKQVFDGTRWIDTEEECEKTVEFTIEPSQQDIPNQDQPNINKPPKPDTSDSTDITLGIIGIVLSSLMFLFLKKKKDML